MSVSTQFLILYSVALAVVSTISTMFFVQTYTLHRRAITWYGGRLDSLDKRWRNLGGDPADVPDALDDPADLTDPAGDPPPPAPPSDDDLTPQTSAPDIIIRDLVAALIPEQLTSTDRSTAADDGQPPDTTATASHAPQLEPGLQPVAADRGGQRNGIEAIYWWNSSYRGRHEAELLIYPTAQFPLVVRNEGDGGSRR